MPSPWLSVPLADYEGHMRSANVQQLDVLSDLFADVLAYCKPSSVAVLGVAGGNGLDRIDPGVTKRVIGIDINASYLEEAQRRYSGIRGLQLICVDLAEEIVNPVPVQLVHAALVFEHSGTGRCLDNALSLVDDGGFLSAILQLPSNQEQEVSPSGFSAIQKLKPHFSLIDPQKFQGAIKDRGFVLEQQIEHPLPAGKRLWMGIFRRP